jgi:hypothetical protein
MNAPFTELNKEVRALKAKYLEVAASMEDKGKKYAFENMLGILDQLIFFTGENAKNEITEEPHNG